MEGVSSAPVLGRVCRRMSSTLGGNNRWAGSSASEKGADTYVRGEMVGESVFDSIYKGGLSLEL